MHQDNQGLPVTCASGEAAEAYRTAVRHYFEYRLDTMSHVKAALEADPDFALAHCLQGYLFMLFGTNDVLDKARACHARAKAAGAGASERERMHVAALGAWSEGDIEGSIAIWDQLLFAWPHDLLALRLQHFQLFWLGRAEALRGGPARVLEAWSPELPGYGNLLGMLAFGLEECGHYAEAERHGRRAVSLDPEDLWALHAVAHVLEMQGRRREGLEWLDKPAEGWDDRNPFRGHLWWHRALFALELGDFEQVLALYDRAIGQPEFQFYLDVQNAASLLLRLEFQGQDVGERWVALADYAATRIEDHVLLFTDLHHVLALARTKRRDEASRLLISLADNEGGDAARGAVIRDIALPVGRALMAWCEGHAGQVIKTLLPLRYRLQPLGASHAQRDLFGQLLLAAALKKQDWNLARGLAAERIAARPPGLGDWIAYAAALDGQGDRQGAAEARDQAALLSAS